MLVVNLLGGPCTGKSVLASQLFVALKKKGISVDLISEFAREEIYSNSHKNLENQVYVFGHQQHRLWRLQGKVQVAITDSPLLLNICYAKTKNPAFEEFVIQEYRLYHNLNYLMLRDHNKFPFDREDVGRIHDAEESSVIDEQIKNLLEKYELEFLPIKPGHESSVVADILKHL